MKNIRKVVALGLTITTCFYNVPAIYADNSDGFIQNLFNSPDVPSAPPSQDIPAQADEIAPQNLESPHNSFFGVSPLSLPETKSGQVPIEEAAPELIGQVPGLNPIYEEEGLIGGVNVADLVLVRRNFTPREVIQVNAIVKSDLINSFGFSEPMLKDLIEKGLLKIEVDLKNRAAKVLFDPSVVLGDQPGLAYLFDLLGSHKLPSEIRYQLGQGPAILAACTPDGCPPSPPYFLISGSFQVDGQRLELFELNYMPFQVLKDGAKIKGQLYSVRVFDGPSSIGLEIGEPILIKEINYKYDDENKTIHAQIVYPNGFSVASRDVEITKMEDGQYHIQSVVDRDSSGNVIATSKFKYSVLLPGISPLPSPEGRIPPVAYVSLWMISRTDAEGGPLSEVRNISADQATVVLPDGKEVPVTFNPLEELFEKTFKVETLSRIFVEAFSLIGQLGAGGTITIADAERMRQVQARLKSAIEVLPRDQQTEWAIKFNEYLNRGDQILATKTLKVVLADGQEIIVRNTTDLIAQIIRRFRMMDQTGEIDLSRFAGIDPEDLAGLETFAEYIKSRQIGAGLNIPLFDLLSPLGNLTLIDRIVKKYPFSQTVGPVEVLHEEILRYIDGTKPVFDRAMTAAREVFANHSIDLPSSPLTLEKLKDVLQKAASLNQALTEALLHELSLYEGEEVFRSILTNDMTNAVMWGKRYTPSYGEIWNNLIYTISQLDMVYEIDGKQVHVTRAELDDFANRLPPDSFNLFRYPGVKSDVDPLFLSQLISQKYYNRLDGVNLNMPWDTTDTTIDLTTNTANNVYFSYPAKRFQLLEAFLKTWGNEVIRANGTVDFDKLRFRLLISYELEQELGRADEYLRGKIAEMQAFANKAAFTADDYAAMKAILKGVQEELNKRFQPLLKDVIYDTTNEVTSRVNLRYQNLVSAFSSVLGSVSVTITLANGETLVFKPGEIRKEVLDKILDATAVRDDAYTGVFNRDAFLRLHGIDETMLNRLLSPGALANLKQFNFYHYNSIWQEPYFADEEILFALIPQIVGKAEKSEVNGLITFLTDGVVLLVTLGESLEAKIKATVQGLVQDALNGMANITIRTMADLLALRDIFKKLNFDLGNQPASYVADLSGHEKSKLEFWINSDWWAVNNLRDARELFDGKVSNVEFLDVNGVRVPVRQIFDIAGFPTSKNFDPELFPGLSDSDVKNAETWAESNSYRNFSFGNASGSTDESLSSLGRIEVVVNLINRLLPGAVPQEDLPGIFFVNKDGKQEADPEALRKYIKGVVKMQREIIEEATRRSLAMKEDMNRMRKGSYTIEEIEAIHEKILHFRKELIAFLEAKAGKHERQDVIATENQVSLIFQENVFDVFVSIVGQVDLVVNVEGRNVVIPAKVITEVLINYLKSKYGESIAAHHFALLYGISVDDVRKVHKLEAYLSEQVVVLPRNSEFVQIVSQISELGYMQLAVALVKRYASEVMKEGVIDVPRLLELVVDKDRAVAWIKGEADKLYFEKLDELKAFMNGAFDLDRLLELAKIMGDFKVRIVSMMNDFLSGQADDGLKTELENFINSLYQKAKEARDHLLTNKPFEVVIEGQTVSFHIAKEMVGAFVQFIERYLLEHPAPTPVPVPIPDPWQPIIYREVAYNRPLTVVTTEYDSKYIQLPKYDYRVPIWSPIPDFDPNHHLTEFGVLTLFARLVVKYGEFIFTQDANGNYTFNMDLFSNELTKTDEDRAVRRLERLLGKELPAMQDFINSLKDSDGALPIDKINLISEKYLELKEKILILASDAQNKAQKVWAKFMEVYESNLFKGLLSMQVDGKRITFEPKVLDEILMRLHQKGKLDPEFLKKFDEMIKGGESTWEYDEFKYLRTYYDWWLERSWGGDIWGISFTEQTVENPELSTTAGTFTLGDLLMLPGISRKDLSGGLDVAEKDGRLILTPVDPIKLLGLLDMRALAPGSGVNVGGLMTKANSEVAVMSVFGRIDYVLPFRGNKLDWKSFCFKAFELIPAMIKEMGIKVIGNDGKVNVESFEKKALRFERVNLPPSTTLTTADITELPGNPGIARVAPEGNSSGVSSTSRGVELFYDTNVGGWAGGGFTFDDFGTYDIETVDLSGFTQLVFGLKGGTDKVKFEIVDGDDHKASAELSGILPDQEQVWTIPTSMLQGVNLTKVRLIYFIVEGGKTGTLEINRVPTPLFPSTTFTTADINLPRARNIARVAPEGNSSGVAVVDRGVRLLYDTHIGGWAGGGFTYDNFSTPEIETTDFSSLSELIFGLQGDTSKVKQVKFEIIDDQDRKASIQLSGIRTDREQVWVLPTSMIQGINLAKVRLIYFIVEGEGKKGILDITSIPMPPVPPLPKEAIQTLSNPHFYYTFHSTAEGNKVLTLYELKSDGTVESQVLAEAPVVSDIVDVTPDEFPGSPVVIFETGATETEEGRSFTIHAQRTNDPNSYRQFYSDMFQREPTLQAIIFEKNIITLVSRNAFPSGTVLDHRHNVIVETDALQRGNTFSNIISAGTGLHVDSDTPLVIQPEHLGPRNGNLFQVYVYDVSQALNRMTLKRVLGFGGALSGQYTFADAYTLSNGTQVVSIGLDAVGFKYRSIIEEQTTHRILYLDEPITSVIYDGSLATYTVVSQVGVTRKVTVNLETLEILPSLPEGWTRATSNPNYAFRLTGEEVPDYGGPTLIKHTLFLMDLTSGEVQELASDVYENRGLVQRVWDHYDVSPDGTTVIYGVDRIDNSFNLYVQRIANSEIKATVDGASRTILPTSIGFLPDGVVNLTARVSFASGTVIEHQYTVNLESLEVTDPVSRIVERGEGLHIDQDTPLVVQAESVDLEAIYPPAHRVFIYDAADGLDHLRLLRTSVIGNDGGGKYLLIDAHTTPAGRQIVSIGLEGLFFDTGVLLDARSGEALYLDGVITIVSYQGNFGIYSLTDREGKATTAIIDFRTLQELEGWTRASSNLNYAFRQRLEDVGTNKKQITLELLDLRSGEVQILTQHQWSAESPVQLPISIASIRDVSPDNFPGGPVVVYEFSGTHPTHGRSAHAIVQRVANPQQSTEIFNTNAFLESIRFEENKVLISFLESGFFQHNYTVTVFEDAFEKVGPVFALTKPDPRVYIDEDSSLVIVPAHAVSRPDDFVVPIYDSSEGLDKLYLLKTVEVTIGGSGNYTLTNAYTVSNGDRIVSIGLDTSFVNTSVIMNINTGQELRLEGAITGVQYDGNLATYQLITQDGSSREVTIDLETLTFQPSPGWVAAASNPNYAFRQKTWNNLELINIRTGEIYVLLEQAGVITNFRDVSPDDFPGGPIVIFQENWGSIKPYYVTTVQRIGNPEDKGLILNQGEEVLGISFEDTQAWVKVGSKSSGQVVIEDYYSIKSTPHLQVIYEYSKLIAAPENIHVDADTPLVIRKEIEETTIGTKFFVMLYDSSEGLDHLRFLEQITVTYDFGGGNYASVDAYTTSNGYKIVSIGIDGAHHNMTFIMNRNTAKTLRLDGAMSHVQYDGSLAIYRMTAEDGSVQKFRINLETLRARLLGVPAIPDSAIHAFSLEELIVLDPWRFIGEEKVEGTRISKQDEEGRVLQLEAAGYRFDYEYGIIGGLINIVQWVNSDTPMPVKKYSYEYINNSHPNPKVKPDFIKKIVQFQLSPQTQAVPQKEYIYRYGDNGELAEIRQLPGIWASSEGWEATDSIDGVSGKDQDSSAWHGENPDGSQDWLELDLGEEKEIDRIVYDTFLRPANSQPGMFAWQESFQIEGSLDGANWFNLVDVSGKTKPERFDFKIKPKRMRYIRIKNIRSHGRWSSTWHFAYLSEIEVYEKGVNAAASQPILIVNA